MLISTDELEKFDPVFEKLLEKKFISNADVGVIEKHIEQINTKITILTLRKVLLFKFLPPIFYHP